MSDESKSSVWGIVAKLSVFLVLGVAAVLVSHYTHIGQYFSEQKLREVAQQLGHWGPVVIVVLGLVSPLAFLPRWPLAFISGMLYGLTWGTLLATVASTGGAWLNYRLSRTLLAPATEKLKAKYRLDRLHVPREKEFIFIFLMRAFPLSNFVLTNLMAGALRMRPRRFVVASFLGMIPSSLMYAAAGKLVKKPSQEFYYVALAIVVLFVVAAWAAQKYVQPWLRDLRGGREEKS